MRILLTGGTGFIGQAIMQSLAREQHEIIHAVRTFTHTEENKHKSIKTVPINCINRDTVWTHALNGVDCVIHCAANTQARATNSENLDEVNVFGTQNLICQAAQHKVKRFIMLSSVKAIGEQTLPNKAFDHLSQCFPTGIYGKSKCQAEEKIRNIARKSEIEFVIIRLPLVYGPGVKGNFLKLIKAVYHQLPMPFSKIYNKRSLIFIDNAVSFVQVCIKTPKAANETFLISDDHDVSTSELVNQIAVSLGKNNPTFRFPNRILRLFLTLFGKKSLATQLLDNLEIDISETKRKLNWIPPVDQDEAMKKTANWFIHQNKHKGY